MLNEPTLERLKTLRLDGMLSAWTDQRNNGQSGSLGFDDTRHTMFARSSAISSPPNRSTAIPTGLPRA